MVENGGRSLSLRALTHELDWVPTSGRSNRRTHSAAFRFARFLADTVFAYTISLDQDRVDAEINGIIVGRMPIELVFTEKHRTRPWHELWRQD